MLRLLCGVLFGIAAVRSAPANTTDGPRVILTVLPEKGGLGPQLFALAHSLFVATAMGWDYELPEFLYHSREQILRRASMDRILDVEQMQAAFLEQGTTLYAHGTTGPAHSIRFQNPPISRPVCEWIQRGQEIVDRALSKANCALSKTNVSLRLVHVHPGAQDVSIRRADWRAFRGVVSNFYFAPKLACIAQQIIYALEGDYSQFNAVHLPIEEDYTWNLALQDEAFHSSPCLHGAISCLEKVYFPVFRKEDSPFPYYVASSILSVSTEKKAEVLQYLKLVAPVWFFGSQFLTLEQGQDLWYEQLAVVDLLVLAHADLFIGTSWSTFTHFTLAYRASKGLRGRELFVDFAPESGALHVQ